jgi:hypothetical protein
VAPGIAAERLVGPVSGEDDLDVLAGEASEVVDRESGGHREGLVETAHHLGQ